MVIDNKGFRFFKSPSHGRNPRFYFTYISKRNWSIILIVSMMLLGQNANAQESDARIDVTFIKTDSSETRYLSLINYSNQPIELHLEKIHCEPEDKVNILTIKDSSISLGAYGPGDFIYLQNYSCIGFSEYSKWVIEPFSALIIPIKEPEGNFKAKVYFELVVPNRTSISLNNKKEEEGYPGRRLISFKRTFY